MNKILKKDMKKTFCTMFVGLAGLAVTASAATVELIPSIEDISNQSPYNSADRLTTANITAADVQAWLGTTSRSDGWYTTTGNGQMNWGQASVNVADQSIILPNMSGVGGVCAGLKMSIDNIHAYDGLTFSFSLAPPGQAPVYTYSLWYETIDGTIENLCKGTRGADPSVWDVSYDLTSDQMAAMKENGNGKVYAVLASTAGHSGLNATITDISLEGTLAVVPEPATASLGLLGLAALMMRRRRA